MPSNWSAKWESTAVGMVAGVTAAIGGVEFDLAENEVDVRTDRGKEPQSFREVQDWIDKVLEAC